MLNRRKQLNETDNHAITERQALLETPVDILDPINDGPSGSIATEPQNSVHFNSGDQIFINTDQRSAPKLRKVRDKLYSSRHVTQIPIGQNVNNSTSQTTIPSGLIYHSHGNDYELSRVGSNSGISDCSIGVGEFRCRQLTSHIYYTIQPGDTLQNLSVKYSCPVASIKRLNNIWSDQDFFGLSKLRLPVGKLRLLENAIQEESPSFDRQQNQLVSSLDETIPPSCNSTKDGHLTTSSSQPVQLTTGKNFFNDHLVSQSNFNESFGERIETDSLFKNLDLSIERARTAARYYDDNANAIMQTLAQNGNIVDDSDLSEASKLTQKEAETLLNDLSDFGLSYNFLLLFIFIVCLVCPLAYVIYLEETHRDLHHHNDHQLQHHEQSHEVTSSNNYDDLANKAHFES